jgi:hypothetical protein
MNSVYEIRQERKSYAEQHLTLEQIALSRTPNYRHRDGRIYASKSTDEYYAVSVSPYNPKFYTQIEDGVKDIIQNLVERNYLTLSCCEGHKHKLWTSHLFFTVAFGDETDACEFASRFSSIDGVTTEILNSIANVKQIPGRVVKYEQLDDIEHNVVEEYKDYNRLFGRSYSKYWLVRVELFARRKGIKNLFWNIKNHFREKRLKDLTKKEILSIIVSLKRYEG